MELRNLSEELKHNPYPGRGIVLGRSADDKYAVIAYFIMGRSENSRNRIFSVTEDGIRTEAYDPSKMEDPSLIIYHPVLGIISGAADSNHNNSRRRFRIIHHNLKQDPVLLSLSYLSI